MPNKKLVSKCTTIFMAALAQSTDTFAIPMEGDRNFTLTNEEREICEAVLEELHNRAIRMLKDYHTDNPQSMLEIVRHELASSTPKAAKLPVIDRAMKHVRAVRDMDAPSKDFKFIADMGYDCGCNGFGATAKEAKENYRANCLEDKTNPELRAYIKEARANKA